MNQMDVALDPLAGTMRAVTLDLPWPAKELSPNARIHHMKLYKAKKKYRRDCFLLAKIAGLKIGEGRHRLDLLFHQPTAHRRDRDNLLASMKSGLDGIAEALGVDDGIFDPVSVSVSPYLTFAGIGKVQLTITPYIEGEMT